MAALLSVVWILAEAALVEVVKAVGATPLGLFLPLRRGELVLWAVLAVSVVVAEAVQGMPLLFGL